MLEISLYDSVSKATYALLNCDKLKALGWSPLYSASDGLRKTFEIMRMKTETYCSIARMAELVAREYEIGVRYELDDIGKYGYANTLYMDLDVSKLEALGWKAETGLQAAIEELVGEMMERNEWRE